MRSSAPPCDGIHWYSVNLEAVDADAARHIYSDIYTDGSANPNLVHLLDMVGNMPLAITLMTKVGKLTGLSAEQLVGQYEKLGTAMLGQGSDAAHSMDICISLSICSPSMKGHPEAFNLVATFACWHHVRHASELVGTDCVESDGGARSPTRDIASRKAWHYLLCSPGHQTVYPRLFTLPRQSAHLDD